jgi:hypothetical protein
VAQLGARFHGMEEVIGSIPIRSTNQTNNLADTIRKSAELPFPALNAEAGMPELDAQSPDPEFCCASAQT